MPGNDCSAANESNTLKLDASCMSIENCTNNFPLYCTTTDTTDSQGVVTTAPANLSGYSVNAVIKDSSTSTTQLLFASTQNRMISIDFTNARATLTIPVKNTSRLPVGTKYYFINLVASDGNTQKIIQGIATVSDT